MSRLNRPHDCDACTYLKTIRYREQVCDLYLHHTGMTGPTLIARYGKDENYYSWPLDENLVNTWHLVLTQPALPVEGD